MSGTHRQGPESLPDDDAPTDVLAHPAGHRPLGRRRVSRWVWIPAAVLGGLIVAGLIGQAVNPTPDPASSTTAAPAPPTASAVPSSSSASTAPNAVPGAAAPSAAAAPPPALRSSSPPASAAEPPLTALPPACQAYEDAVSTIDRETPRGPDVIPAVDHLRVVGQGVTRVLRRDADAVWNDVTSERWASDGNVFDPPFTSMLNDCFPDAPP